MFFLVCWLVDASRHVCSRSSIFLRPLGGGKRFLVAAGLGHDISLEQPGPGGLGVVKRAVWWVVGLGEGRVVIGEWCDIW